MTVEETQRLYEIEKEIKEKRELQRQMVGWLYPSILEGEIEKLKEERRNLLERGLQT